MTKHHWEFPTIDDLPHRLRTEGWTWNPLGQDLHPRRFWVGTDKDGRNLVVKMRGKWDAIRERVYSSLAQIVGICTQSSVYLILDLDAAPLHDANLPRNERTRYQSGLWMFKEHAVGTCGPECPMSNPSDSQDDPRAVFDAWLRSGIRNPWDWFDATMLGYLCAKFEPSGQLITTSHLWVQIDNEYMFSAWPFKRGNVAGDALDGMRKDAFMKVNGANLRLNDLCARVSEVTDAEIERILEVPEDYRGRTQAAGLAKWLRQARSTAGWIVQHGVG
jgi:hypothetical protein